jgi:hypothetical protein
MLVATVVLAFFFKDYDGTNSKLRSKTFSSQEDVAVKRKSIALDAPVNHGEGKVNISQKRLPGTDHQDELQEDNAQQLPGLKVIRGRPCPGAGLSFGNDCLVLKSGNLNDLARYVPSHFFNSVPMKQVTVKTPKEYSAHKAATKCGTNSTLNGPEYVKARVDVSQKSVKWFRLFEFESGLLEMFFTEQDGVKRVNFYTSYGCDHRSEMMQVFREGAIELPTTQKALHNALVELDKAFGLNNEREYLPSLDKALRACKLGQGNVKNKSLLFFCSTDNRDTELSIARASLNLSIIRYEANLVL